MGSGAVVVAALYTATRPPFALFVLVQVLAGYGTGILESVLNAHLAGLDGATTLLNRMHAFFGVGALLGPLLAAWVLGFATWTAVWLVLAIANVPLVAGFLRVFPRQRPTKPERASGALLTTTLRQRGVILGAVLLAVYVGLEMSVGNWGFSYLAEERGQRDVLAGYTVSGYWLGLTLGRFLISPVATRVGLTAAGVTFGCLAGVAATATLTWLLPSAAAASAGFVLLGFFLGPIFPTTMAVAPLLTEARLVPTAIGVMNAGSVVGGSALPWLAGAIAQGVGGWTLLPFAVALALVQVAVWWRITRRVTTDLKIV